MIEIIKKTLEEAPKFFPNCTGNLHVPWIRLTTLGVGTGTVLLVIHPNDGIALSQFLKYCYNEGIKVFPIGEGSNIVGTDNEFQGIVLKLNSDTFEQIKISNTHVVVGAGIRLYDFILACGHKNLGGIEQLAGIPGTIGGSLSTNAGRFGVSIGDIIQEVYGFDLKGNPWRAVGKELNWGYRKSSIPEDIIVTSVKCKLLPVDSAASLKSIKDYVDRGKKTYPPGRSAGCVFRNPASGHGAGKLIDLSGCKNFTAGNLKVSNEHANFIVNKQRASERDFLDLAIRVKKHVLSKTGIYLEPEVRFADDNALKTLDSSPEKLNVAVLKGGTSHERPVSLESAQGVCSSLIEAGYNVCEIDLKEPVVTDEMKRADIVFPMLHGGFGENGQVQKVMEKFNIPYVGCSSKVSELIINKITTKDFFTKNNIPTPGYTVLKEGDTAFPDNLSLPVVVKPPTEGSTFGISIVRNMSDWIPALEKAAANSDESKLILIEDYIDGFELTVGILDGIPLPIVHICPPGEMYDYDAKYTHNSGETQYICPPDSSVVSPQLQDEIMKMASEAYKLAGARDMLRVDLILSKGNKPYFIEMNTIPGFTHSSLLPKAAAKAGIPYIQLCGTLVQLAKK